MKDYPILHRVVPCWIVTVILVLETALIALYLGYESPKPAPIAKPIQPVVRKPAELPAFETKWWIASTADADGVAVAEGTLKATSPEDGLEQAKKRMKNLPSGSYVIVVAWEHKIYFCTATR